MNVLFDLSMVGNCCLKINGTTYYDDELFSYNNTYTINIIKYISTKNENILKTIIVSHIDSEENELDDITLFHLPKDGHYIIEHLIIPNKLFIDNTLNEYVGYNKYNCLYATDGNNFYKKNFIEIEQSEGPELLELPERPERPEQLDLTELLDLTETPENPKEPENPEQSDLTERIKWTDWIKCDINDIITSESEKTTIYKASLDTFSICILNRKYLELCKKLFCKLVQNPCLQPKELHNFELDLLWMGINAIKYNVELGNLFQAQSLLEEIISCTGIPLLHKSIINKKTNNDCGCL